MLLTAVQHVRRMRGGAQSHLMRADDANYYVVKFQNNPQHVRVLANDFMASRLAERVGLPAARAEIIEVGEDHVPDAPPEIDKLLGKALAKDPQARFQSMREMAEAIARGRRKVYRSVTGESVDSARHSSP